MIVFRDHSRICNPATKHSELELILTKLIQHPRDHESARDLLLCFGEIETAFTDRICRHRDSHDPRIALLRRIALHIGEIFCHSWAADNERVLQKAKALRAELAILNTVALPAFNKIRVPEGYAYYGFYPEMFVEAAKQFHATIAPGRVVCIGIRSIGTSLSSAIWAQLRLLGCQADGYTVRPRGHPFDRHLTIADNLRHQWRLEPDAYFLVADEGPGLSGSSFCSVATTLSGLGVPDNRIVFFPSWDPGTANMASATARERWARHRKFIASFEEVWLQESRVSKLFQCDRVIDLSAGKWRDRLGITGTRPMVQPSFERRKYLCLSHPASKLSGKQLAEHLQTTGRGICLAKFAGIGLYGRPLFHRAVELHSAGFAPQPRDFSNGFLLFDFVPGQPLDRNRCEREFCSTAVQYLSFLEDHFPAGQEHTQTEVVEMIHENIYEGLGRTWAGRVARILEQTRIFERYEATAIDGRIFPHEWIETPRGFIKTDGVEHHADHFFPGCQNILWDLAGLTVEFNWTLQQRKELIGMYESNRKTSIRNRLPYYEIAYLAYRLGYCIMASQSLGNSREGRRFEHQANQYASHLKQGIVGFEKS